MREQGSVNEKQGIKNGEEKKCTGNRKQTKANRERGYDAMFNGTAHTL